VLLPFFGVLAFVGKEKRLRDWLQPNYGCNLFDRFSSSRYGNSWPHGGIVTSLARHLVGESARNHPLPDEEIVKRVLAGDTALFEV